MRSISSLVPVFGLAMLTLSPAPIAAQDDSGNERVNAVIVYGQDECPKPVGEEITICARKPEAERFRIPKGLRDTPSANSESWNSRVIAYERVGKTGTLSCSPTGAGGWTGCSQKLIDQAYAERNGGEDLQFGRIIEEERAKRLGTLDADAAAAQARVEEAEREQDRRKAAEAAAAAGQPVPPPPTAPGK